MAARAAERRGFGRVGYYTTYTLKVTPESETERIRKAFGALAYSPQGPFDDECKWYDHDEHIAQVARENPDVLIQVDGVGEEQGDFWRVYARGEQVVKHHASEFQPPGPPAGWASDAAPVQATASAVSVACSDSVPTVWVVLAGEYGEGGDILDVFASESRARDHVAECFPGYRWHEGNRCWSLSCDHVWITRCEVRS